LWVLLKGFLPAVEMTSGFFGERGGIIYTLILS
jgi:hypothetical protein